MKCDKVKKLLLTDHVDGESHGRLAGDIEEHLAGCKECREFCAVLREKAVAPFKALGSLEAPGEVWEGIRQRIGRRSFAEERAGIVPALWAMMPVRRAVLAAVSLAVAVFMLSGVQVWRLYDRELTHRYMEMQSYYFTDRDTETEVMNGGFGTAIEEYFL